MNTKITPKLLISACSAQQFEEVKKHITNFELDDRALVTEEFLVATLENNLVGFGRIREFETCSELCSLGVIEPERYKGIGSTLTLHLLKKAKNKLFLVCIIPDFFKPLGFEICVQFPKELKDKLNYCNQNLPVSETYVVMQLKA